MHRNWHSEEFDYLFTPLKGPLPTFVLKCCYTASFFPHTAREWNHLPPDIPNTSSVDCFNSSLMKDQHINDFISKSHDYN